MNHPYLSSASLKALARGQLMGHYGTVVGAYLIHMLCILPFTLTIVILFAENTLFNFILSTAVSFLISLVSGLFVAGEAYMYLKIACNQPVSVGDLFYCFQHENTKVLNIQAVMAGVSILTTLPAAILGFISPFSHSFLNADSYSPVIVPSGPDIKCNSSCIIKSGGK